MKLKIKLELQFYVLGAIALFLFAAASNIQSGWLYIIDSLLISILIYSIINPISQVSKLKFERKFYGNFDIDNFIEIETIIINNSNRKINFIEIETSPAIRIIDNEIYGELENKKYFIIDINKKSNASYISRFKTDLRGLYIFPDIKITSYGAFGFVKYTKSINQENIITVLPSIKQLRLELLSFNNSNKEHNYSKQLKKLQDNSIPYNIREYRAGDSFRLINWKATARRNQLMVKELEAENSLSVQIIIDTFKGNKIGKFKESNLEYILKISTGIFKYFLLNKYNIEFMYFDIDKINIITETTSNKDFLSYISSLDANSNKRLIELINENNYKKTILAFFLNPSEKDINDLNHFYNKGFKILPFFIDIKSFNRDYLNNHIANCKYKSIKIDKYYNFDEAILI